MQPMYRTKENKQAGFTITELVIAIPLAAIVVVVFIGLIVSTLQSSSRNKTQLDLTGTSQSALTTLERDVRYSSAYLTSTYSPLSDPNAPGGGWTHRGTPVDTNSRVLLLKSFTTINNPYSPTRTPVYVKSDQANPYSDITTFNCSSTPPSGTLYLNPQLPYATIYFVSSGTLYRRVLTDTTTTLCNSAVQYQKQSCPTGSGSPCVVKDEAIADNVIRFSIDYYKQEDTPTPTFTLLDPYKLVSPDDIALADDIVITLGLQKNVANKPVQSTLTLRVSRINNN